VVPPDPYPIVRSGSTLRFIARSWRLKRVHPAIIVKAIAKANDGLCGQLLRLSGRVLQTSQASRRGRKSAAPRAAIPSDFCQMQIGYYEHFPRLATTKRGPSQCDLERDAAKVKAMCSCFGPNRKSKTRASLKSGRGLASLQQCLSCFSKHPFRAGTLDRNATISMKNMGQIGGVIGRTAT